MTDPTTRPPETDAEDAAASQAGGANEAPPTPFDHPLFLPVLLAAFSIWFGYDGYLNTDPDMQEHLAFNRFGLRVIGFLTAIIGYQGFCELKQQPASPWIVPAMLAASALWAGFDGWFSEDALNIEYQPFIRHAAAAWAVIAVAWAVVTALRAKGTAEPFFVLPLVVFGLSAWFGLAADAEDDLLVAYLSSCAGLFAVGIWLLNRKFRGRKAAA